MLKRSLINKTLKEAADAFAQYHWNLPPRPRWDITDFGLGEFRDFGLTLVNLAEEPEYCEKLMFAYENQRTPAHTHKRKKEDIICRNGRLSLRLWPARPGDEGSLESFQVPVNGEALSLEGGGSVILEAGSRITLLPGIYHECWPVGGDGIIGEVSTANDDENDNFFVDERIGRFPGIEEDAPVGVRLVGEG